MTYSVGEKPVKQWLGVYKGIVINNADPLGQQRVQAQVPQVLGPASTTWASPLLPIGTQGPPVGTFVAVVFLGGDPDKPAYINQTSTATDWTLPALVIGDSVFQAGTLAVNGTMTVNGNTGSFPATSFTGGLQVDTLNLANPATIYQPGTTTIETWHNIPIANGWSVASGYHATYRLTNSGDVALSGRISSGTNGTINNTALPAGYYPATSPFLSDTANVINPSTSTWIAGQSARIAISSSGVLTFAGFNALVAGTVLSLDGMFFPVSAG